LVGEAKSSVSATLNSGLKTMSRVHMKAGPPLQPLPTVSPVFGPLIL
jgi:hypothetical protein